MYHHQYILIIALVLGFATNYSEAEDYGCEIRPSCEEAVDNKCENSYYYPSECWADIYYQCAHGVPYIQICNPPTVVNQTHINDPTDTSAICVPVDQAGVPPPSESCNCDASCETAPSCPDMSNATNCTGSVLIPHPCDCQLYWVCDSTNNPVKEACGPGQYFSNDTQSCVSAGGIGDENDACTSNRQFEMAEKAKEMAEKVKAELLAKVPVAPVAEPARHPITTMLLALEAKGHKIPNHLAHYLKKDNNRLY